jgi:hypothetical protein
METVCHPLDNQELLLISAALEGAGIPYFIVGQNFGSLYPGMQIATYNERTIRVPRPCLNYTRQVVQDIRSDYTGPAERLNNCSKLRMIVEALLFGWFMPGGTGKKSSNHSLKCGHKAQNHSD